MEIRQYYCFWRLHRQVIFLNRVRLESVAELQRADVKRITIRRIPECLQIEKSVCNFLEVLQHQIVLRSISNRYTALSG